MFAKDHVYAGTKQLLAPFLSPAQYDFWARQLGSTRAWSRCFARVVSRSDEAKDTITLRLQPNQNFGGFAAGQHVNLTAVIQGCRVSRSYSFSNIPNVHGWVEFTVRRDPAGLMSRWLFDNARPGTVLELDGSFGDMTAAVFGTAPLLLLAAGSGITPLMSLLREQAEQGMPRSTTLCYWARTADQLCFERDINALADAFKNFTVHKIVTSGAADTRISEAQLRALGVGVSGTQIMACGGGDFVERARKCTAASAGSFQAESFSFSKEIATACAEQRFKVDLLASGRSVEVSNRQTLLEALQQHGVAVSSGCRMGICNTCSCLKTGGITQDIESRTGDTSSNSRIRLCVTRAASDLQLAI